MSSLKNAVMGTRAPMAKLATTISIGRTRQSATKTALGAESCSRRPRKGLWLTSFTCAGVEGERSRRGRWGAVGFGVQALKRGDEGRGGAKRNDPARAVDEREDDRVIGDHAAIGQQNDAPQPIDEQRAKQPEEVRPAIVLGDFRAVDVERQDDHGGKAAGPRRAPPAPASPR